MIVVPSLDVTDTDQLGRTSGPDHAICIETEADVEPTSPKTMTESSSKLTKCVHLLWKSFNATAIIIEQI